MFGRDIFRNKIYVKTVQDRAIVTIEHK